MNPIILLAVPTAFIWSLYVYLRPRSKPVSHGAPFDLDEDTIARLPDHIRLVRIGEAAPELPARMGDPLLAQGFEDAGTFTIDGMPEVAVQLFAHRAQSMYCTIWSHAAAGSWFEFSTRYPGGRKATFTSLAGAGFDGRPDHTIVRVPGASLLDLYVRACAQRPMGVFAPASVAQAVSDFENGYAMWMTWRRAQSRGRVAQAA